jgi:hypothetical protein
MQHKPDFARPILSWDVVNPTPRGAGRPPKKTVDLISFVDEKLSEVGAILPCDSCNDCFLQNHLLGRRPRLIRITDPSVKGITTS